ncbi:sensor histidine kinase [Thiorhodospira sibirica]|uniref:sensor histidine kinase n=1 Tax=Thiorhodospira sibirica TaxID=154347 RepID=UPI00022C284D|nr:HAMP domain-containing sensor histidine kinase [Thiorhodospira sibirica]
MSADQPDAPRTALAYWPDDPRFWHQGPAASINNLRLLLERFLGQVDAQRALYEYAVAHQIDLLRTPCVDPGLITFCEQILGNIIGHTAAKVMVSRLAQGDMIGLEELMQILEESSQLIAYSQQLESKSRALEAATEELRIANERLHELDRMKDDFISTVTHELRTPLTSIRSFTEILYDNPKLPELQRQEFLAIIIRESERLTRLINQVLDLSRLESEQMHWVLSPTDIVQVVQDAIIANQPLFQARAIALHLDAPATPLWLDSDSDRLQQVITNLLANAAKFSPAQTGQVWVQVRREGTDSARIVVKDNGPGIALAAQTHLFEKFQQVGGTLTNKPEGTGLGLAICRQIIKRLGGTIWVESDEGQGAAFHIRLSPP